VKKRFFKGGVIALLVLASGVEGYAQQATLKPKETDVIKIASQANPSIPLTVPPMVEVKMKGGQLKSGRLVAIDSQQITLYSGKNSTIGIASIDWATDLVVELFVLAIELYLLRLSHIE